MHLPLHLEISAIWKEEETMEENRIINWDHFSIENKHKTTQLSFVSTPAIYLPIITQAGKSEYETLERDIQMISN